MNESTEYIINPATGRPIKKGGRVHRTLLASSSKTHSTKHTVQSTKRKKMDEDTISDDDSEREEESEEENDDDVAYY